MECQLWDEFPGAVAALPHTGEVWEIAGRHSEKRSPTQPGQSAARFSRARLNTTDDAVDAALSLIIAGEMFGDFLLRT